MLRLFDAGAFRVAPFLLKPWIYRDGAWLLASFATEPVADVTTTLSDRPAGFAPPDMVSFLARLEGARVVHPEPVFKLYHLTGMHEPLTLDEHLRPIKGHYDRETYVRQATGVMRVMAALLAKIEALGIADRTLVVIAGDHGSGRSEEMWIKPEDPSNVQFNTAKARACALLLIRRPSDRDQNELRVSRAQVSLVDLPATILSTLGLPVEGLAGRSVYEVGEDELRERRYVSFRWRGFHSPYLGPITEWVVEGDSWEDRSWTQGSLFVAESDRLRP